MILNEYPVLIMRIKALMVDVIFLMIAMILISQLFSLFDKVQDSIRIGAFIILFGFYDPIMTSFLGGTLGHLALGIRVRRENTENTNISFAAAFLRFIIKSTLGWISLVTVTSNKRKRAIHDMISGSVVTFQKQLSHQ